MCQTDAEGAIALITFKDTAGDTAGQAIRLHVWEPSTPAHASSPQVILDRSNDPAR